MGRHLVYLGHLIAYVHFKIPRKISSETESLPLPVRAMFQIWIALEHDPDLQQMFQIRLLI